MSLWEWPLWCPCKWWRNSFQKTRGWKEASSCWEVTCERLPIADKLQRLTILLNPQEITNSGHKKAAESVQYHWHTSASTTAYKFNHTWEGRACYMQTTTGLKTHLEKQGTLRALLNPRVHWFEQYELLGTSWAQPPQLVLQDGNWECGHVSTQGSNWMCSTIVIWSSQQQLDPIQGNSLVQKRCSKKYQLWSLSPPDWILRWGNLQ